MKGGLFDQPVIDMSRGPADIGEAPSGVRWDKNDVPPVSGRTPAARNASASGAMAAATWRNTRAQQLVLKFLVKGRLTIAEAAVLLLTKEGNVTGPWNLLEHKLGWIEGTREYFTYQTPSGATVKREYHQLTAEGRAIALDLQRQQENRS